MKKAEILPVLLFAMAVSACAQHTTYLECGAVIDLRAAKPLGPTRIAIQNGKIVGVEEHRPNVGLGVGSGTIETIDLRNETCLPGLIDTHTHVLLQGDITLPKTTTGNC